MYIGRLNVCTKRCTHIYMHTCANNDSDTLIWTFMYIIIYSAKKRLRHIGIDIYVYYHLMRKQRLIQIYIYIYMCRYIYIYIYI